MSHAVADILSTCTVAEPQTAGGLTVFGLKAVKPSSLDYATLDEALAEKSLTISELSEGGSVPTLKLVNNSKRRVFLLAGEQLIGAKQNRILNTSILVEAGAELPIPVSCVEQGRWSYKSKSFNSAGTAAHGKLRSKLSRQVSASYLSCSAPVSDQGEVWSEVSRKAITLDSPSPSMALSQVYDDHSERLSETASQLACPENCQGVVFVRNGAIVGADLFDQPATLKRLWSKLLMAQLLDVFEDKDSTAAIPEPAAVRRWLDSASQAEAKPFPSPGLGQDVRLTAPAIAGAGLVVEDQPVHVQVFAD